MGKKKSTKYELRYDIASERNKITGYTLIPKNDHSAEAQHMNEQKHFRQFSDMRLRGSPKK